MEPVQITWELAFKIWWAFTWRALLLGFPPAFAVGFVVGFLGFPNFVYVLFSLLWSVFSGIAVMKWWILGKDFGDFELWPLQETSK